MKFRKKPVVIEAIQWIGDKEVVNEFMGVFNKKYNHGFTETSVFIKTLEGNMEASLNDWIIKGVKGEFYPCKPDIFEATYEKVEE